MATSDQPFGEQLARLIKQRGLSKREVGRRTDSPGGGTVSNLIKGYHQPSVGYMEEIAAVLEVEPETFAEYRLEKIRQDLDWRPAPGAAASARKRTLSKALANARALGLDV